MSSSSGEIFDGKREKEKWINKGTEKQYVADSLIHSTTCHLSDFVPNFRIVSQVVPEKSLTEKERKENG